MSIFKTGGIILEQKLYDRVKNALENAKEDNTNYCFAELKYFIDMLYQDYLHDEWGFETCQIREEKNKRINQAMFVLLIDKESKETTQLFFSLSDKRLLKKLYYLSELDKVNTFITISTFRPQKNYDKEPNFRPFRRIHRLAYKCNVLTADLDFYHKKGRFEGKTPEEVWEVIKVEKKCFVEKLRVVAVKSGGGLQLYVPCQTFYFNGGRTDKVWERFNEAFNFEFKEYGADPKCISDKSRVYRFPGSKNWKGDDAITVKILTDINTTPTIYNNDELRYALSDSLFQLKDYSFEETEKLLYYGENYEDDDDTIAEEYEEDECNNDIEDRKVNVEIEPYNSVRNNKSYKPSLAKSVIVLKEEKPKRTLTENARLECQINGSKGHRTLIINRLDDLIIYAKRRNWDLLRNRNEFLFIYGIILWQDNLDTEAIYNVLSSLNNKLKEPLKNNEIIATVNSIANGNYRKIKNITIAEKLGFTKEDIAQMKSSYSEEEIKLKNAYRQKRWYQNHKKKDTTKSDMKSANHSLQVWNFLNEVKEKNLDLTEKQIDEELQVITGLKERQVRKYKSEVRRIIDDNNNKSP